MRSKLRIGNNIGGRFVARKFFTSAGFCSRTRKASMYSYLVLAAMIVPGAQLHSFFKLKIDVRTHGRDACVIFLPEPQSFVSTVLRSTKFLVFYMRDTGSHLFGVLFLASWCFC